MRKCRIPSELRHTFVYQMEEVTSALQYIYEVSYDHRCCEHNLGNCVYKPEKVYIW